MTRIVVDTTFDFTKEEASALGIELVPLSTTIDNVTYKDRFDLTAEKFYTLLENTDDFPKTSQPSPEDFLNVYNSGNKEEDILVLTVTSKLSGTCQSANLAKSISEKEDHIYVIDTCTGSFASKLVALKALELVKENKDIKEIVSYLEEYKTRIELFAVVDTLDYLLKGGRISKTSAFAGSLLKFKPVLTVLEGKLEAIDKKRGMNKATSRIVELVKEKGIDKSEPVLFGYSGNNTDMDSFIDVMKEELELKDYTTGMIGPVIGSHAGPGAKLIAFVRK